MTDLHQDLAQTLGEFHTHGSQDLDEDELLLELEAMSTAAPAPAEAGDARAEPVSSSSSSGAGITVAQMPLAPSHSIVVNVPEGSLLLGSAK